MENKATVVVADDDPDILYLIQSVLSMRGYTVVAATSGTEALEIIRVCKPHAVVLDWMMPGLAGPDLCAELKTDEETAGIPVVLLTAKTAEGDIAAGFQWGADEYLTKPFDIQELENILQRLIGPH